MNRTHPQRTKQAIDERQTDDFCSDCDRYYAFCDGRKIWFEGDEYWVCERCISNGRPQKDDENSPEDPSQGTILQYIDTGDSDE